MDNTWSEQQSVTPLNTLQAALGCVKKNNGKILSKHHPTKTIFRFIFFHFHSLVFDLRSFPFFICHRKREDWERA